MQPSLTMQIWLIPALVGFTAALIVGIVFWRLVVSRRDTQHLDRALRETEHRLSTVLWLNRELANARSEKYLVEAALSAVNRLVGGLGCSFVPFDAWGQPMPAFTFGGLPDTLLKGWADHLASEQVRQRCQACQDLHSAPDHPCPLQPGPSGSALVIHCLPLALGQRALGLVNIYLPPGGSLPDDLRVFLEGLLSQMALAVETVRLQSQELLTLRQLHHLRSPRSDLTSALTALLEGVRRSLGVDALLLQVRPLPDERLSGLRVAAGDLSWLPAEKLERAVEETLHRADFMVESDAVTGSQVSMPLALPEGRLVGVLLAFERDAGGSLPQQVGVLQTVGAQAALMLENERTLVSLEYTLVMQERTRLAREIHDGLAQTLAFLKMQSAQIQSALGVGDTARLNRLISENRQAIADAYQETRHAIDNLRVNPEDHLSGWLENLAGSLERSTGVQVKVMLQAGEPEFLPEIQAQLVRIVQEALNNVRKHAKASSVQIILREWAGDLLLEVIDDGQGFDPDDVPAVAQYGLRGMRERAELIGAEFQIVSQPKRGTTVRISIPTQLQENAE